MKIMIAVIMLILASSASAQVRAELKLEITPLLGLQRNYTEEIRSSRDTVKTETKEENTLQELPSQNIHLISTNNSQTQNLKFYIETGGSPRSLKHQAEIIIPIELITKETENASEIEFSISGYYNTSTENFQNTKINESFKYTFNKIKLILSTIEKILPLESRIQTSTLDELQSEQTRNAAQNLFNFINNLFN